MITENEFDNEIALMSGKKQRHTNSSPHFFWSMINDRKDSQNHQPVVYDKNDFVYMKKYNHTTHYTHHQSLKSHSQNAFLSTSNFGIK